MASALHEVVTPQRVTGLPLRAAVIVLGLLALALVVIVLATTPWSTGLTVALAPSAHADLTAAQYAAARSLHARLLWPGVLSFFAPIVIAALLGFTTVGSRIVVAAGAWAGGSYWARLLLGGLVVTLVTQVVALPFGAWGHVVRASVGLDLRSWSVWATDAAKSAGLGTAVMWLALVAVIAVARWKPTTWWVVLGGASAVLVVLGSLLVPVLIEPLFTKSTPLPDGPLRTEIMALAREAGTPVRTVLVAHTSAKTSGVNAHVSGFGPTRRVVLDDTLLERATPAEVRLVVAHELGHAARNDVARATIVGALAAVVVVLLLFVLLADGRLLARAGASAVGDPRALPLVLALYFVVVAVMTPMANVVSRHVEARADLFALNLTHDPAGFVAMQRTLSTANLLDPTPPFIVRQLFGTHPTLPERAAMARSWAAQHGQPVPGPIGGS